MVENLLIHLGGPKTGSTSIQKALSQQTWHSEGRDLYYPVDRPRHNHFVQAQTLFHSDFTNDKHAKWSKIAHLMAASKANTGVISSEHFARVRPEILKSTLDKYFPQHADSVRLVFYIRPHIDRLASSYGQKIKTGEFGGSLDEYYMFIKAKNRLVYYKTIAGWSDQFGDQFEVRPMIRSRLYQHCVVRDFLNYALDGAEFQLTEDPNHNMALGVQDLSILREFYHLQAQQSDQSGQNRLPVKIGQQLARILSKSSGETQIKLQGHKTLVSAAVEHFRADAELLDARYFTDAPMTTALDGASGKAIDAPQSTRIEDNFTVGEIRNIRAWIHLTQRLISTPPGRGLRRALRRFSLARLIRRVSRLR